MSADTSIHSLFATSQNKVLEDNREEIIQIISNQKDKVVIKTYPLFPPVDAKRRSENPHYLDDELFKKIENGVSVVYPTEEFVAMLSDAIPSTIKELTIPVEFLSDVSFLNRFQQLEKLTICTSAHITLEEIEYIIANTNIKEIHLSDSGPITAMENSPGAISLINNNSKYILQYKGIKLAYKSPVNSSNKNNTLNITIDDFTQDISSLEALCKQVLEPNKPTTITIKSRNDKEKYTIIKIEKEGEIASIEFNGFTPTEAADFYKKAYGSSPIITTEFRCENKTYADISELEVIDTTSNLVIKYNKNEHTKYNKNKYTKSSLDDYISMRATIDYYKGLITAFELSPLEKIAYVYDLLKSWKGHDDDQNKSNARELHSIVRDGNIVCLGYSEMAKQLLLELGIPAIVISAQIIRADGRLDGHARNLVRVDDDKYNVHGLYSLDISLDSDQDVTIIIGEDGKKEIIGEPSPGDQVEDRYDSLVLYRHFLTPLSDYEKRYNNENDTQLIREYIERPKQFLEKSNAQTDNLEIDAAYEQHYQLFAPEEDPKTVESYLTAPKPSLETFQEVIQTVRKAQGYNQQEASYDVQRIVALHHMLNAQNPERPNLFFK